MLVLNNKPRAFSKWSQCSSRDLESMTILFKYISTKRLLAVLSTMYINRGSMLGDFFGLNSIPRNLYPAWCDVTVFFPFPVHQSGFGHARNWHLASRICTLCPTTRYTCPHGLYGIHPWQPHYSSSRSPYRRETSLPFPNQIQLAMSILTVQAQWHSYGTFYRFHSSSNHMLLGHLNRNKVDRAYILRVQFDAEFWHFNAAQTPVLHILKFSSRVQNFVMVPDVLFDYVDVFRLFDSSPESWTASTRISLSIWASCDSPFVFDGFKWVWNSLVSFLFRLKGWWQLGLDVRWHLVGLFRLQLTFPLAIY